MDESPTLRRQREKRAPSERVTDRLPPFDLEAEKGVLGCFFLDPIGIATAIEALKDGAETFYDLRHQTIYKTIVELWSERDPVDIITVYSRLNAFGEAEQVGGLAYIQSLPDVVPSAVNLEYYLEIVKEKYLLRRMIRVCTETVGKCYDSQGNVQNVLDECERDVLRVNESRVTQNTPPIKALVKQAISNIEVALENRGEILGLATGFSDLDKITNGLKPQQMITIAARPGMGKTSLAMNIAEFVAVTNNIPVGVFSLEMGATELTERMIFSRARVNLRMFKEGFGNPTYIPRITGAADKISKAPIYIDDAGGQSILQVRAKARRMWQQYGIKLFVIDYLQLMNALGGERKHDNRQQEVSDISNGVKSLAKELQVPVIVLSQLNRDFEKDKNRLPRLSDLRESGSIEQDSDLVAFLYPQKGDTDEEDTGIGRDDTIPVNLLIAKHRNGPTGLIYLTFMRQWTRFESAAKVSDEDVPAEYQQEMV